MSTYKTLKIEHIECPFCSKIVNLYEISRHNKSKKCKKYKEMYLKVNKDKSEEEIELYLNSVKNKVLSKNLIDLEDLDDEK